MYVRLNHLTTWGPLILVCSFLCHLSCIGELVNGSITMTTLPKTPTPAAPGVAVVVPADEARKTSQEESVASGKKKSRKTHYPFWFGGSAASMAACVTHPLDLGMFSYCFSYFQFHILSNGSKLKHYSLLTRNIVKVCILPMSHSTT